MGRWKGKKERWSRIRCLNEWKKDVAVAGEGFEHCSFVAFLRVRASVCWGLDVEPCGYHLRVKLLMLVRSHFLFILMIFAALPN